MSNLTKVEISSTPLDNPKLYEAKGALLTNTDYPELVSDIAELYADDPSADYFATEADWQSEVATTGVCGKFVYDSVNSTVRLPKYGDKLQTSNTVNSYGYNVDFIGDYITVDGAEATITQNSSNSYIKTKDPMIADIITANTWKLCLQYELLTVDSQARNVFSAGNPATDSSDFQVFQSGFENNNLRLFLGSNGGGWDIASAIGAAGSLGVVSSNEFLYELEFTGTQYKWQMTNLTRGDSTPTTCDTINSSTKVGTNSSNPYYWILGNFQYRFPAYGSNIKYNLANSYYTIDGTTTYLADTYSNASDVYYYIQVKE